MHDKVDPGFFGSCFICGGLGHDADLHAPRASRRGVFRATAAGVALAAVAAPAAAQAPAPQPRGLFVLEPDWVLATRGGEMELLQGASVIVRGESIEEVRPGRVGGDVTRIPLPGQILLPGLISGHTHVCAATPTRGIIEGGRSFARPLELVETLSDDELDALTAFNLAELLRTGCTTQVEMALSLRQAKSYVRVARRWGVRGWPGGMIPGIARLFPIWFRREDRVLTESVPGTLAEIAENLAFARDVRAMGGGLLTPMMSPHATDTHTPETMTAILAAARELGSGLHIHLSQSARETETVRRLWGTTPAGWLERLGFGGMPVFAAHLTGMDLGADPDVLKRLGAVFSHCPSAGGAGGSGGMQAWPEMLAAGVATNIGIDTHSNDMLENVKLAVIVGRTRARLLGGPQAPRPVKMPTIWDAVAAATIKAADGLGRRDLGRIEAGAKADLVSVAVSGLVVGTGATPPEPLNNLLYASGQDVRSVMTNGLFQVREGRFVADDEARVIAEGGAVVQRIWDRLRAESWFQPTAR
jgi:cytosine/adenosine deaminase-related metal-dependent hydrolase